MPDQLDLVPMPLHEPRAPDIPIAVPPATRINGGVLDDTEENIHVADDKSYNSANSGLESLSHNGMVSRMTYTLGSNFKVETPKHSVRDRIGMTLGWKDKNAIPVSWRHKMPRTTRSISEYPPGYSRLAAYEDSDPNLLMYRKFGWLHNRILLHHQDELVQLEEELEQLDQYDEQNEPERLYSRRRDDERHPRRKELLHTIEEKLGKFDELLLRMKDLHAISRPTKRNQTSLWNLIQYSGNQAQAESEWIKCSDDLGALASNQENNRFNGYVEDALTFTSRRLTTWLFRTKSQNYRTGNEEHLMLWSRHRYHAFVYAILTVLATVLLLVPIALLYEVKTVGIVQISIIFGFTLFFSASCAIFTSARVQEIFAATAAYAAVLVVFLGNNTPQNINMYANGTQIMLQRTHNE